MQNLFLKNTFSKIQLKLCSSYLGLEKLIDLVDKIDDLRQECFTESLIQPNTYIFRYYQNWSSLLEMNETA